MLFGAMKKLLLVSSCNFSKETSYPFHLEVSLTCYFSIGGTSMKSDCHARVVGRGMIDFFMIYKVILIIRYPI